MFKVSFVKIDNYNDENFENQMEKLISPFIDFSNLKGKRVLLKPNLLIPEPAEKSVTTHPKIVEFFIKKLKSIDSEIIVGDSPAVHSAHSVAKKCGILEIVKKYNVPLINFEKDIEYSVNSEISHHKLYLTDEVKKADYIINLAKVKTHGQMRLTLSVKNLFGTIAGIKKAGWHIKAGKDHEKFAHIILSVSKIVDADLHILDGIFSMDGNGPRNGRSINTKFMAASDNPYSLDLFVAKLLGYNSDEVPTLKVAQKLNFKGSFFEEFEIVGDSLKDFEIKNFEKARPADIGFGIPPFLKNIFEKHLTPYPLILERECKNCKLCKKICQSNAIYDKKNSVKINFENCIHCFCCQEVCPHNAIIVKEPLLLKLINKFH